MSDICSKLLQVKIEIHVCLGSGERSEESEECGLCRRRVQWAVKAMGKLEAALSLPSHSLSFLFTLPSLPLFGSVEYVFSIKVDIMLPRFIERTNELGNNGRDAMKAINFNSVCSPPLPAANEASKGQDEANCCSCC